MLCSHADNPFCAVKHPVKHPVVACVQYGRLEEDYEKLHNEYREVMQLFDQEAELVGQYRREVEQQDTDLESERQGAKRLLGLLQAACDERAKLEQQLRQQAEACQELQGRLVLAAAEQEQLQVGVRVSCSSYSSSVGGTVD